MRRAYGYRQLSDFVYLWETGSAETDQEEQYILAGTVIPHCVICEDWFYP